MALHQFLAIVLIKIVSLAGFFFGNMNIPNTSLTVAG
jgi:hypothetical protein